MTVFSIESDQLGAHEILVLRDIKRGRCVRLARRGAVLIGLEQAVDGGVRQLADGYRDSAELESRPSSRFAIMAPFANRIADARYRFDGRDYDLQPGVEGAQRAARHGFVRGVDFDVAHKHADESGAHVTFATSVIRPGKFDGYPFAVDVLVTYTLDASGLTLQAHLRNVGQTAAPCFFGWHPYFRLGDQGIDAWELTVPATTLVRTDGDFIPLPGAQAYQPLDEAPRELDFRRARPIGATDINHAYANLAKDADGRARTSLRDPVSGMRIHVWQESGVMLVFTADTVTRDARRAVALEPMESMSDAFNRADCASAVRLEPGAERLFRCGVEIDPA
ncbi:MAG TPA: aldose epimerase [Dyella sp.]|uniref:aldose 1-epimerase n=1 Tax=Dyella sp. TaxID=1869338 RepID=UPI002CBDFAEB|nr:aldose epimerase [Dyella sp.]HTV83815.1 aldose epimerase [Dyella sp.]